MQVITRPVFATPTTTILLVDFGVRLSVGMYKTYYSAILLVGTVIARNQVIAREIRVAVLSGP